MGAGAAPGAGRADGAGCRAGAGASAGGFNAISGGIDSGRLVSTWVSSGTSFSRPTYFRALAHPATAKASAITQMPRVIFLRRETEGEISLVNLVMMSRTKPRLPYPFPMGAGSGPLVLRGISQRVIGSAARFNSAWPRDHGPALCVTTMRRNCADPGGLQSCVNLHRPHLRRRRAA